MLHFRVLLKRSKRRTRLVHLHRLAMMVHWGFSPDEPSLPLAALGLLGKYVACGIGSSYIGTTSLSKQSEGSFAQDAHRSYKGTVMCEHSGFGAGGY